MRSPRAAGAFPGSPADAPRGLHFQLFEIRRRAKHAGADAFATQDSERQAVTAISQGRARITAKGEGTPVMADKGAIRQIGVNLVTNAFKYSTGGIEIEVAGPEIRYMDRGPGIPRESEDRIFERFYRVDNSLAQATSGSGLGLGADDFIAKPFRIRELFARVSAALRRGRLAASAANADVFTIGSARIDGKRFLVATGESPDQTLTVRELGLLKEFAAHPGEVLQRKAAGPQETALEKCGECVLWCIFYRI